eukprot:7445579-Pyramimonas_sp.AAC.1
MGRGRHANAATGAFGGAPYGGRGGGGTQGDVSSKRRPNTTGWLGKNILAKDPTVCKREYRRA